MPSSSVFIRNLSLKPPSQVTNVSPFCHRPDNCGQCSKGEVTGVCLYPRRRVASHVTAAATLNSRVNLPRPPPFFQDLYHKKELKKMKEKSETHISGDYHQHNLTTWW